MSIMTTLPIVREEGLREIAWLCEERLRAIAELREEGFHVTFEIGAGEVYLRCMLEVELAAVGGV
jgi:hypothetical protein